MKDKVVPVLRIFVLAKAEEFYCGFLGMKIDWEQTFGENFPKYMQVSKGDLIFHLTEHYGDATPGSKIRINSENVDVLAQELGLKAYKYSKPTPEIMPWKTKGLKITDPFGNNIVF
jgi:catechol 2,3-dioxygenase-like lactoylglutathione lyase family enzyme